MALAQGSLLAAVLLLLCHGFHCSFALTDCPAPCTCQRAPLLNCSSSGLSLVPQPIQDIVTDLDLSHNLLNSVTIRQPRRNLRNVLLGNNRITHLSLCIERTMGRQRVTGRNPHRLRPWSRHRCVSWAPTLQLLSVERNQLVELPEGLEGSEMLQVLQLSFNRISTLAPTDLCHLQQLKELHLQHNLITSLHTEAFRDLTQLKVLDLSFNLLTSLHPLTYLSLRNIGADVSLNGNRWQCDCSMRSLRRQMAYDSNRGLQAWSVVCASPSTLSRRDLLQLAENDLDCFNTENRSGQHQDVTVYRGSEILMSCSSQESVWWTPNGRASVSEHQAGLLISEITERDTGLYVCVSESEQDDVSVFNLEIRRLEGPKRKTRSLSRSSQMIITQDTSVENGQGRNQRATQSDLALAVSLSVFITFLVAFILGVLARPLIDVLWRRLFNKRNSSETHSASPAEQNQYENEAYFSGEEPEDIDSYRERRVTFSDVQYYDTVVIANEEIINGYAVIEREAAEASCQSEKDSNINSKTDIRIQQSSPVDDQRDSRNISGVLDPGHTHRMEFENIPDPAELEEKSSLSSHSDSSLSDRVQKEDQMTQEDHSNPQLVEDALQLRVNCSVDVSTGIHTEVHQTSINSRSEIPDISSKPFADCSPLTNDANSTDPDLWQENEESFDFSDSPGSASARSSSLFSSFNDSKLIVVPPSDRWERSERSNSSSSSYVSGDEPTQYTVNPEQEEEGNVQTITNESIQPSPGLNQVDYRRNTQRPGTGLEYSDSSQSRDNDDEPMRYTDKQETDEGVDNYKPMSGIVLAESDTSDEVHHMPSSQLHPGAKWHGTSLGMSNTNKHTDTRATSSPDHSPSSSVSADESREPETKWRAADVVHSTYVKGQVAVKAPSPPPDSLSSSDSTDETTDHKKKQEQGGVTLVRLSFKESQTVSVDPETKWPTLDLGHTTPINRGLDIKPQSPSPDSSCSSESADNTRDHREICEQGKVGISVLPLTEAQTVSYDPKIQWPAVDLGHITHVKRRAPSPPPVPSSMYETKSSMLETKWPTADVGHITRVKRRAPSPPPVHETKSSMLETKWPTVDVGHITRVKRRLDIKAPSPPPDLSSSDASADETTVHTEKQEQGKTVLSNISFNESQTVSPKPETKWPIVDVGHITRVKRRLDIKAPSPPHESSSNSERTDETTDHIEKCEQGKVGISVLPLKEAQTVSYDPKAQWPAVDLGHITHVKRRLDIKAPSPPPDSSSSDESADETRDHRERQEQGKMELSNISFTQSQTVSHKPETKWPTVDLGHITRVKRRLDIKAPSPPPDSSSSDESADETTEHIERQEQGKMDLSNISFTESHTASPKPETKWPTLDFDHITCVKRRLDIKASSPPPDSSSSSESADEATYNIQEQSQGKVDKSVVPFNESQTLSHDSDTKWRILDLGHITRVKRRLDIKAPSPPPDSSSSDDNADETEDYIKRQEQGKVDLSDISFTQSQTVSPKPETKWPIVDLGHITRVKRRLDIKAPSPPHDSSSSTESADETKDHIERQEQGKVDLSNISFTQSQTVSPKPETKWPIVDLGHITRVKRRLDIKAPSPPHDSSSSSQSADETKDHIERQEQGKVDLSNISFTQSQTVSPKPETKWPIVDLGHITRVKRRLDIKAPSPPYDSSSSSESADETKDHIERQEQGKVDLSNVSFTQSQTVSPKPETKWPIVDLGHITLVKRRLDIKAPSPPHDSSSSSESADETKDHIERQEQGKEDLSNISFTQSQTVSPKPETKWPIVELGHITRVKRRLDIKAPSPPHDSSSSSQSANETKDHIERQEEGKVDLSNISFTHSQTVSPKPETKWPIVDLGHITRVKRRLDIKAPSPPHDSSSSSESADETKDHIERQEQGKVDLSNVSFTQSQTVSPKPETKWPIVDLGHITRVKRRLDIKAPSPPHDSSSSSESADETKDHIERQEQGKEDLSNISFTQSQTVSPKPETKWPIVELGHITRVKRRLDIKAPSPPHDSSSSSQSANETKDHIERQEQGKVDLSNISFTQSQTVSPKPETKWPIVDLGHITRVKRRLDIKAPSPPHDSSSSSESADETKDHIERQEQGKVDLSNISFTHSQTVSPKPETKWPIVDLGHSTRVKRRLDIKAPSPPHDSSSSSESADETKDHIERQEQGKEDLSNISFTQSQTVSPKPETKWPIVELGHITRVKRRLDIKAPSPPHDSSSSSQSANETKDHIERQEQGKVDLSNISFTHSQTVSPKPETKWPIVDLGHITRVKRRLDIKAPSPPHDSSSSSQSADETKDHIERQEEGKVDLSNISFTHSQTVSPKPETKWPIVDLGHITRVKRRLDIKAPSPPHDSSSSSESADETKDHIERQEQGKVDLSNVSFTQSQTVSPKPETKWPIVDLGHITRVKRRLDIKAPSPPHDSSSSSESADETKDHIERQEQGKEDLSNISFTQSQTVSPKPETKWPIVELGHITRVKRRLDIKAPSPPYDSSSSSQSANETKDHIERQEQGKVDLSNISLTQSQTVSPKPETKWPIVELGHITRVKRRLDIKAPSPPHDSSSSSESADETKDHIERQEQGKVDLSNISFTHSQTVSPKPETKWPIVDLGHSTRVKRRLDIKAPSPPHDSSSSNESADKTKDHIERQEQGKVDLSNISFTQSQTVSPKPETKWPIVELGHITRVKRRLDIKAPSPPHDSSSSSESADETKDHIERQEQGKEDLSNISFTQSQTVSPKPETKWPIVELGHIIRVKRRLDIKAPSPPHDSSSSSQSADETKDHIERQEQGKVDLSNISFTQSQTVSPKPETKWPIVDLGHITRVKRRLDIKAPSPPHDSSSSSESADETTNHIEKCEQGKVGISVLPLKEAQTVSYNPKTQWPIVDVGHITRVQRRLDIKAPSPPHDSPSSSESADEATYNVQEQGSGPPTPESSSSIDERDRTDMGITKDKPGSVPLIKRRLDIKAPSPQQGSVYSSRSPYSHPSKSNFSSSESEDEKAEFIKSPTLMNISHTPKASHNLKLEKYTIITDEMGNKSTAEDMSPAPVVNPDLQSRWATLNLGISRFRKHLDIASHTETPPPVPLSAPPDSPSSSSSESVESMESKGSKQRQNKGGEGMQRVVVTSTGNSVEVKERLRKDYSLTEEKSPPETVLTVLGTSRFKRYLDIKVNEKAPTTPSLKQLPGYSTGSIKNEDVPTELADEGWRGLSQDPRIKLKSHISKVEEDSESAWPRLSLSNVPNVKRDLDIKALSQSGTSSDSENETMDHAVQVQRDSVDIGVSSQKGDTRFSDQSFAVPPIKRRLNIKATSQPLHSPSSCSESENEVTGCTAKQNKHKSHLSGPQTSYKHLNRKVSSPTKSSPPSSDDATSDHKKERQKEVEKFPVTQELSLHGGEFTSSLASNRDPSITFDDVVRRGIEPSRHTSDMNLWSGIGYMSGFPVHSPRSHLNVTSKEKVVWTPVSEDQMERKGLNALKVMSSERRQWDREDEEKGRSAVWDDDSPPLLHARSNSNSSEKDIKPLAKLSLPELLLSSSYYRTHLVRDIHPPQEAPPPPPDIPPPEEEVAVPTWRSPQSSEKQTRSYQQQKRYIK